MEGQQALVTAAPPPPTVVQAAKSAQTAVPIAKATRTRPQTATAGDVKLREFNWNEDSELRLMKTVLVHKPWDAKHGKVQQAWNAVCRTFECDQSLPENSLTGNAIQAKVKRMLDEYNRKERQSGRASGIEEEHTEFDDIFHEVWNLMEDRKNAKNHVKDSKNKKAMQEKALSIDGEKIRARAMGISPSADEDSSFVSELDEDLTTDAFSILSSDGESLKRKTTEPDAQKSKFKKRKQAMSANEMESQAFSAYLNSSSEMKVMQVAHKSKELELQERNCVERERS